MTQWGVANEIDYSPTGDDIDSFSLKVKNEFPLIYTYLNRLRRCNASASNSVGDVEPYEFKIDSLNNELLIRDADNKNWISLGKIAPAFGVTSVDVGGVTNKGGITGLAVGLDESKPTAKCETYDVYLAYDTCKLYIWHSSQWNLLLSLDYEDIMNRSAAITKDMVATSGANMIVRLDKNGKGDFSITGSAERILGYIIPSAGLAANKILVFDGQAFKWVDYVADNVITIDDINESGAGKIPVLNGDGKGDFSITGSADKILGYDIPDKTSLLKNTVLMFNGVGFVWANRTADDVITESDVAAGSANMIPRLNGSGKGEFNITGSPDKLLGYELTKENLTNGRVLMFDGTKLVWANRTAENAVTMENVATSGAGKVLLLNKKGVAEIDITGSAGKIMDKQLDNALPTDGKILVFRDAYNAWVLEEKPGTMSGKSTAVIDDGVEATDSTYSSRKINNVVAKSARIVQRNTTYEDGAVLYSPDLPTNLELCCMIGGTTSALAPDFSRAKAGRNIVDGEVVWRVYNRQVSAPSITAQDITLPVSDWQEATDGGYSLEVPLETVTEELVPQLTIARGSLAVAAACGFISTCETGDGVLTVFSEEMPAEDIEASLVLMGQDKVKGDWPESTGETTLLSVTKADGGYMVSGVKVGQGFDTATEGVISVDDRNVTETMREAIADSISSQIDDTLAEAIQEFDKAYPKDDE